ncbi:MAG: hypothetical protein M9884_13425 [Rhodocyclaceae bacterium]|nr:hypothetical protein [Rhodocyclaceae bacterium]
MSYRNSWLLMITPGERGSNDDLRRTVGRALADAGPANQRARSGSQRLGATGGVGARRAAARHLVGRIGQRKPLYVATSALALLGWGAVIYLPALPLPLLIGLLMLLGFVSGSIIIGFA